MKKIFVNSLFLFSGLFFIACNSNWPYKPTPYIAPVPPPPVNGFVSKDSLKDFLGTSNVKLVYTEELNGVRNIYFVNFNDSLPTPQAIKKPSDKQDWSADSPLLSPDGKLVTYYLLSGKQYAAYLQKLDSVSEPVLISNKASDPHFYKDDANKVWIVYADTGGKLDVLLENLTTNATLKQQINPLSGELIGDPIKIANKPMYGGLSKDGKYLCTGYTYAYMFDVTSQTLYPINAGLQTCNPSITQDSLATNRMMFLNINGAQNMTNNPFGTSYISQHQVVYIADQTNTVKQAFDLESMFSGTKAEWQDPEWTNKADFFVSLASEPRKGSLDTYDWDAYCIKISTKEKICLNNPAQYRLSETATPYIFIGSAQ